MSPRSAPYLWVQLINGGALPLEALLLLLLLAGADPGPVPVLERVLAWALGAAAPALLLWRRPADPRSLLLVSCTTADAGSAEPDHIPDIAAANRLPQLVFAAGVVMLLPLLNWLDGTAALASQLSPLQGGERLTCLMAASGLLALMVWQWQQLVQAIWLLSQNSPLPAGTMSSSRLLSRNLGLPLLHLQPLAWADATGKPREQAQEPVQVEARPESSEMTVAPSMEDSPVDSGPATDPQPHGDHDKNDSADEALPEGMDPDLIDTPVVEDSASDQGASDHAVIDPEVIDPADSPIALAVEPEQAPEHGQGSDLDQQID